MKNLKYILATLVSMVCASCMQPFDLKLEDDPVIFLEAFPGAEDMVVFTILPAYANTNTPLMPEFHPHIVFTVNGEEIPVVLFSSFFPQLWLRNFCSFCVRILLLKDFRR